MAGITLQINLAPPDLKHVRYTLPHQLRQWAHQVDEILLTVDVHRSRGRYGEGWEEGRVGLRSLLDECCQAYPHARVHEVNYARDVAARLSWAYFGGQPVPLKDFAGAPFYAYVFGIDAAQHDVVLHMDSDMLFGGGSATWMREALELFAARGDVFACNPLPGPPTADGTLRSQTLEREPFSSLAYRARGVSTRILLLDRRRLRDQLAPITIWPAPTKRQYLQAWLDGNPPKLPFEDCLSRAMARQGLVRIDFLGAAPGMWSIHPPFRSPLFYERLPHIIERIELGRVPEGQRGDHDLNDSMVDWTSARQLARPLRRRALKHLKLAAARPWLAVRAASR